LVEVGDPALKWVGLSEGGGGKGKPKLGQECCTPASGVRRPRPFFLALGALPLPF
jgi:hypothetical protein